MKGEAVETTLNSQTDLEVELRIDRRARLLRIEKQLASHHRAIAALAGELEHFGESDLSEQLLGALWGLTAATSRVAAAVANA